jgi:hypothetical protein
MLFSFSAGSAKPARRNAGETGIGRQRIAEKEQERRLRASLRL